MQDRHVAEIRRGSRRKTVYGDAKCLRWLVGRRGVGTSLLLYIRRHTRLSDLLKSDLRVDPMGVPSRIPHPQTLKRSWHPVAVIVAPVSSPLFLIERNVDTPPHRARRVAQSVFTASARPRLPGLDSQFCTLADGADGGVLVRRVRVAVCRT